MSGKPAPDFYATLGLDKSCTLKDIKKAYRKLAMKYHPDRPKGDEQKFKEVSAAYEVLSDPKKRKEYDSGGFSFMGGNPMGGGGGGSPFPGGVHFSFGGNGFGGQQDPRQLFEMFFGQEMGGMGMGGGMGGFGGGADPFAQMFGGSMFGGMGGGGMNSQRSARRQQTHPAACIPLGQRVVISGLQGAAQHNGKTGRVTGYDTDKDRYTVSLTSNGNERLALKQKNLTQLVKGIVVTGVESNPEYNGQKGAIQGRKEDRYIIRLTSGGRQTMLLHPAKVLLPLDTRVEIFGLSSGARHNGKKGKIEEYDPISERYIVAAEDGSALKIKRDNVRA
eukprot:g3382.t1